AGRQGRYRRRRRQAGHPGDRGGSQRALLRQRRRRGAHRHPHRQLPGARLMDLQSIKELIQLVERSNITELQIENGDLRIAIKKGGSGGTTVAASAAPPPAAVTAPAPAAPPAPAYHTITSPMVGTFYAAPSP